MTVESQLDINQAAYEKVQDQMERSYTGRTVLMHDGNVVEVYDDDEDAYRIGCDKYGLGNFSLVNVGEKPIDLGFLTMFVNPPKRGIGE